MRVSNGHKSVWHLPGHVGLCLLALWTFFSVFPAGSAGAAAVEDISRHDEIAIKVHRTSTVDARKICLRDIAEIQAPAFLKEALAETDLGFSPDPGRIKILQKDRLLSKLSANRLIDGEIPVEAPEKIYIKRRSQTLDKKAVEQLFMAALAKHCRADEYKLRDFDVRGLEVYPGGNLTLHYEAGKEMKTGGRFSTHIDVIVDGRKVDSLSVRGWIDVYDNLVCAGSHLERKHVIEREDLFYKRVNISELRRDYATDMAEVAGKIPRSDIEKGGFIPLRSLEKAPLVRRGEMVRLVAAKGNLEIVTSGISKEDGCRNESVKVKNSVSGEVVRGFVRGRSYVEVLY